MLVGETPWGNPFGGKRARRGLRPLRARNFANGCVEAAALVCSASPRSAAQFIDAKARTGFARNANDAGPGRAVDRRPGGQHNALRVFWADGRRVPAHRGRRSISTGSTLVPMKPGIVARTAQIRYACSTLEGQTKADNIAERNTGSRRPTKRRRPGNFTSSSNWGLASPSPNG
jgi:hypothetical protein